MHGAIFCGFLAADFEQAASALFFGSDSSNTRKKTVSFNSRTSRGDRLVVAGPAVFAGSGPAAFLLSSVAAGGAAAGGAALAASGLVDALEAAAGSEVGDAAGGDFAPQAASKSDEARTRVMK